MKRRKESRTSYKRPIGYLFEIFERFCKVHWKFIQDLLKTYNNFYNIVRLGKNWKSCHMYAFRFGVTEDVIGVRFSMFMHSNMSYGH